MLCKCSGKYIDIYFILKITFLGLGYLGFFLSNSIVSLVVLRKLRLRFQFVLALLWLCVCQDFFCEQFFWLRPSQLLGVAVC